MPFYDLQAFVQHLEHNGQLKRVRVEVDPELEVTEISQRVLHDGGPALLFERPKGSSTPLLGIARCPQARSVLASFEHRARPVPGGCRGS
jgi:UbiD family decarboxylase